LLLAFPAAESFGQAAPASKPAINAATERATSAGSAMSPALAGTWRSAPDELRLTSDFDKSVWGPDATSVRTTELTVMPSGDATLRIERKVVDGKGRTIAASTSIEEARITIGGAGPPAATRIEHAVKVVNAERRYPDDPDYKWPLEGVQVQVVTFEGGDAQTLEVRFETPEGRGSFWETLRRQGRAPRPAARK
jgi:hypothetical protein